LIKAQVSTSGGAVRSAASSRFRIVTGVSSEMSFLYLVVMVAANTKYSINSLLSPAPDVTFWKIKIAHEAPHGDHPSWTQHPDSTLDF
jgi:hypothetical protein